MDFEVTLKFENCLSEFMKYEDLESTDIIDKAHYKFYAIVDDKANIEFEYNFKVNSFEIKPQRRKVKFNQ